MYTYPKQGCTKFKVSSLSFKMKSDQREASRIGRSVRLLMNSVKKHLHLVQPIGPLKYKNDSTKISSIRHTVQSRQQQKLAKNTPYTLEIKVFSDYREAMLKKRANNYYFFGAFFGGGWWVCGWGW